MFSPRLLPSPRLSLVPPRRALPALVLLGPLAVAVSTLAASYLGFGWFDPLGTIDGTYQTYSMLHRLDDGQMPGRDYTAYLGILLNYALLLPFKLLGSTVFAAFAAAQLSVHVVSFALCVLTAWLAGSAARRALALGAVVFSGLFLYDLAFPDLFAGVYRPGYSIIAAREAASLIVAGIVLAAARGQGRLGPESPRTLLVIPAAAGFALFWSNAAGVATFLVSMGVFAVLALWRGGLLRAATLLLAGACVAAASVLLTAALVSGGDVAGLLHENFLGAADFQFWFFGGFREGSRILTLGDLLRAIFPGANILVMHLVVCALLLRIGMRHGLSDRRTALGVLVFASLFGSALVMQVGGHVDPYYYRVYFAAGAMLCLMVLIHALAPLVGTATRAWRPGPASAAALLLALGIVLGSLATRPPAPAAQVIGRAANSYIPELGMRFPAIVDAEVEFLRQTRARMDAEGLPPDSRAASTYFSWADVLLGAEAPSRFSSIIHVYGDRARPDFLAAFARAEPPLAVTMNPEYTYWYAWNLRSSWYWFRHLLAAYEPAYRGTSLLYWRRRAEPAAAPFPPDRFACRVRQTSSGAATLEFVDSVPPPPRGRPAEQVFLDVSVGYSARPAAAGWTGDGDVFLGRGYLRVADSSSALIARHFRPGPLPLPPLHWTISAADTLYYGLPSGDHAAPVPVEHQIGTPSRVTLEFQGLLAGDLEITGCAIRAVLPSPFAGLAGVAGAGRVAPQPD